MNTSSLRHGRRPRCPPVKLVQFVVFIGLAICIYTLARVWTLDVVTTYVRETSGNIADAGDVVDAANETARFVSSVISIGELPDVSYTVNYYDSKKSAAREIKCHSNGLYLGDADQYVNCSVKCNSDSFQYRFFPADSYLTKYFFSGRPGAYCIPRQTSLCNASTATIVRSVNEWSCIAKWPSIFGGSYGTSINSCNGQITDMLTQQNYTNSIPITLYVENPYIETVARKYSEMTMVSKHVYAENMNQQKTEFKDGYKHPRFVCTDELIYTANLRPVNSSRPETDAQNNEFIPNPKNRFSRIVNACTELIPNAVANIRPDFDTETCNCLSGNHALLDLQTVDRENIKAEKYEKLCEIGHVDNFNQRPLESTFQQPGICSPCPFGFVYTDINNKLLKPNTKSNFNTEDRGNDYFTKIANFPVSCISSDTPITAKMFGNNFLNVRLCTKENAQCVNTFLDVSTGLSNDAKRILVTAAEN